MLDTILDAVGHTPLVQLNRLTGGLQAKVAIKVESQNPGGSVKDRVAMAMIAEAEQKGLLRAGGTIIEATAGNTGVGLAMVAAVKGYRCIFVLPDKMSNEKIALLKAYGAEVVITQTAVAPDSPESYNGVADRLSREIPGAWRPNQFTNLANPECHYRTTGPEIWEQTRGKITVFVAGVGTGGTVSGVGKYLKERNPNVKVVGADPEGSVLSGGSPKPWKVEGIGEDFVPKTFTSEYVDDWERVSDAESFHVARELARREGMLLGGSTGTNVAAALRYARRLGPGHLVVALGCDTGRNYLSKFFDDNWLSANKLSFAEPTVHSVGDLLKRRGERKLVTIAPDATAEQAIHLMEATGISQLPVMDGGRPVGSVQEVSLARILHDGKDPNQVPISEVMGRPLPVMDVHTHLDESYRLLLAGYTGVLATSEGKVVDIVTRIDLIHYWDETRVK
ncbi:MAG: cystathionine beta-synthase [Planctomycetaceae bacterium]|nr:cystathionine beta-synthase [Planctomycetaceae bacterium]